VVSGLQSPEPARHGQTAKAAGTFATATGYGLLLVFGLLEGLTGSVQFSRGIGPVPLAAIGFALGIGLTCALCGRGMGSGWGAICPSAGWVIASFAMAMPDKSGSVVITNSTAGQVYLYGGALCAAIGVGVGMSRWPQARSG
jgi:hypothetical protein